jgi:hypothetical protein
MVVGRTTAKIGPNWGYDHGEDGARTLMTWHTIMARVGRGTAA